MLSFTTTTLAEALKHMKKMGAASMKLIMRDRQDRPLSALILIEGKEESADAIAAFDKITDAWSDGRPACSVLEWKLIADELPDADTTVLIARHGSEFISEAYLAADDGAPIFAYANLGEPTITDCYAWAELPAAPAMPAAKGEV